MRVTTHIQETGYKYEKRDRKIDIDTVTEGNRHGEEVLRHQSTVLTKYINTYHTDTHISINA